MTKATSLPLKDWSTWVSTFGLVGCFPFAPGTMGSLATVAMIWVLKSFGATWWMLLGLAFISTAIGILAADRLSKLTETKDAGFIVIDEVAGQLFASFLVQTPIGLLASFVFFRFFDILKFWPASHFDKKVKGGLGIVMDDVISGFFALICFLILSYFLPGKI